MTDSFLQVRNVSFAYGRGSRARTVLSGISLDVAAGSVVGLLGPNGSGKTTLIKLISGLLPPQTGEILVTGKRVSDMSRRDLAKRVAVVPQETRPTFDFSALDTVLMGRYPHLGPLTLEGPEDVEAARAALAATGALELAGRTFGTLSGGEKQRVIIASALAQASEALVLDEPTTALDLRYQFEVMSVLRRLNAELGTTLLVCTHDLNFAAAICHEIVMLKQGRVLAQGSTADTLTASNIRRVYDVDADVQLHPAAGHLTVVPIGKSLH